MISSLITDRTSSDLMYAKSFQGKKWDDLSTEQKAEYLSGLKGTYSYIDFNRVENAVEYISELLISYAYYNTVKVRTNWTAKDIQRVSEIQRYLNNIAELKNKYYSNVEGELPTTDTWLTTEGANYIEKVLAEIDEIVFKMTKQFRYSNTFYSGESEGLI